VSGLKDAVGLLTTIGRRGGSLSARALGWFPVLGAALGALVGACWWAANEAWTPFPAAVVVVVADLAVTGMLHVDGLADSADGLLPHADRERRLAIMRAPDVGAFGVAVVGIALIALVAALASQPVSVLLVIGLWMAARSLVAAVPALVPYAREDGIATSLLDGAPRWPVLGVPIAALVAAADTGARGATAVVVGVAAGIGVLLVARRRLGGFTGDVLGATIVVVETIGLVVASARW
jgi:adenosylcobinamide-GDP ribazoletransferase